jgi:hypothetical protein
MCEILIFVRNNTHIDPEKDRRGCYKRGMPVCVFEDGHTWGREESKQQWIAEGNLAATWPGQGKFVILKIPGVLAAEARALIDHQMEDDAGVPILNPDGSPKAYRRRRWQLLADSLPLAVRNTLASTGEYAATVLQVRAYLTRIRDAAQYTGLD